MEFRVFFLDFSRSESSTLRNLKVRFWYTTRNRYFLTVMFNGAPTSGFKSVLKIWLSLHNYLAICYVFFLKMFDMEILHKMLNYAFLKIQAQQSWEIAAAVCFSLYLPLKWMLQLC